MLLYVLVAIGLVVLVGLLVQTHRQDRAVQRQLIQDATQEDLTRQAVREDVSLLASDVERDGPLDELGAMVDESWTAVLHGFRQVKDSLGHAHTNSQLSAVTEHVAATRQLLKLYRAALLAEPMPEVTPPCFFNPNHGPSETSVTWYTPDGEQVRLPSCAADARRLASGAAPYARTFRTDAGRQPWWLVGEQAAAWARGWFASWRGTPVWDQLSIAAPALGDDHDASVDTTRVA